MAPDQEMMPLAGIVARSAHAKGAPILSETPLRRWASPTVLPEVAVSVPG